MAGQGHSEKYFKEMQKALEAANSFMGKKETITIETVQDKIREAQSVINYFEARGRGFYTETCRSCNDQFVYAYNFTGVKYCSIPCMDAYLRSLGLSWSPEKAPGERWGRFIPAVISADAYRELPKFPESEEKPKQNSSTDELLRELGLEP